MMQRLYQLVDGPADERGFVPVYCPTCGKSAYKLPAAKHWHACYDCRHLGAETREVGCNCPSNRRIKVFACGSLGECTMGYPVDGIACCNGCSRYEPASML